MAVSISIIATNIADIVDFEDVAQRASELKKIARKIIKALMFLNAGNTADKILLCEVAK
jgi:amino acid transporter